MKRSLLLVAVSSIILAGFLVMPIKVYSAEPCDKEGAGFISTDQSMIYSGNLFCVKI